MFQPQSGPKTVCFLTLPFKFKKMNSSPGKKKNNTYCSVPQCKSKGSTTHNISFHKFPAVKSVFRKTNLDGRRTLVNRRKEWIRILKIGKEVSNRMTVCSKHFDTDSFTYPPEKCQRPRLKASALPSLFLPTTSSYSEERMAIKKENSDKRMARYSEINRKKRISNARSKVPDPSAETADSEMSFVPETDISTDMPGTSQISVSDEPLAVASHSAEELTAVQALLQFQSLNCTKDNATQVCSGDLKTQHLIKADDLNDRTLLSLTGLPSLRLLNFLAESVAEELKFSKKHHLPIKERIILTMMRMYLNISFSSLAVFFGCSTKTACNIFFTIIPLLSGILGLFIEWLTKEEIIANLPHAFQSFQNVRVVLDCTEILVQKPQCLTERLDLYSHYYKDLTVKFLIGASLSGFITFVSRGYGGKASDKHIFCES